jgi:hypothetical protein
MFTNLFVNFSFGCRREFSTFSLYKQFGLGQNILIVKRVKSVLIANKQREIFSMQGDSMQGLKTSVLKLCTSNTIKLGFKFQAKKLKSNLNVILKKRKKSLFISQWWQKATVPFFFNNLNFAQVSVISRNRDVVINPFFGGLRRGFNQGLLRSGIREFKTRLLVPRWYRLQKLKFFRKQLLLLEKTHEFIMIYSHSVHFYCSLMQKENFDFLFQFYIRKRWNLAMVLAYQIMR